MVRIGSVVMNAGDVRRAGRFWAAALGYQAVDRGDCVAVRGGGPSLWFDRDDRMHLDLRVASAAEQQAEVERLIGLGATRVDWDYPDQADFVVLADTEGNLFCVVNTAA